MIATLMTTSMVYRVSALAECGIVSIVLIGLISNLVDDDIDGVPMEKLSSSLKAGGGFIPSKWETVDPDQVIGIFLSHYKCILNKMLSKDRSSSDYN